ncbi:transposase [Streptomyces sp. NPDC005573]|uniref:transposase n=1 Tax=Streptomyces sp. NPDC005573 TaxID=3156890 RepID=UPI0033A27D4F
MTGAFSGPRTWSRSRSTGTCRHDSTQGGRRTAGTGLGVFRTRPLDDFRLPDVCLHATCCKARVNHQIASQAVVIATDIAEDGGREALGLMVGGRVTDVLWSEFLRSLREHGLRRSDAASKPSDLLRPRRRCTGAGKATLETN